MRTRSLLLFVLPLSLGFASALSRAANDPTPSIAFIVNSDNPVGQLSAQEVTDFFLKKTRHWRGGDSVRFIDRRENSPQRSVFLREILKKTSRDLELYWIGEKLYTGASAPIQVEPDAAVATLVASFKGAIGYVGSDFKGAKGVKVIPITDREIE